jgi:hypothetical protein
VRIRKRVYASVCMCVCVCACARALVSSLTCMRARSLSISVSRYRYLTFFLLGNQEMSNEELARDLSLERNRSNRTSLLCLLVGWLVWRLANECVLWRVLCYLGVGGRTRVLGGSWGVLCVRKECAYGPVFVHLLLVWLRFRFLFLL